MTAIPAPSTKPPSTWQWPADVLEFASRRGITAYLDLLLEAVWRLFPTARLIEVKVDRDPEYSDYDAILFLVHVPSRDVPDFLGALRAWHLESARICPCPQVFDFLLHLNREEP